MRLKHISTGEIERILGQDLHLREMADGSIISYEGDEKIIAYAYKGSLTSTDQPGFSTEPKFYERKGDLLCQSKKR